MDELQGDSPISMEHFESMPSSNVKENDKRVQLKEIHDVDEYQTSMLRIEESLQKFKD